MGLDLILAALVLVAGIRGWLKGFVMQALRLTGLIACVYVADPVRDLAKPRVIGHLPTMQPELVDRLLWWSSAALSYVVLVGVASLVIKLSKRKRLSDALPNRNDQFGGFLIGLSKGLVTAVFLTAALHDYALGYLKAFPRVGEQTQNSWALAWTEKYQPAAKLWSAHPVQHFVKHIQKMGLQSPEEPSAAANSEPLATTESRPPKLAVPPADLDPELAEAVRSIQEEIQKLEKKN